ncbi:hypothetical protein [Streptomyces sp. RFCAC02]|uniref:hypothetical protein n=1 Tax=Streptomyces sp. RFCAC02 TaxID=2499143 RepID=UPI0010202DFE|nr:hypothetical protein [Streptomyces sp. RFCAC02]
MTDRSTEPMADDPPDDPRDAAVGRRLRSFAHELDAVVTLPGAAAAVRRGERRRARRVAASAAAVAVIAAGLWQGALRQEGGAPVMAASPPGASGTGEGAAIGPEPGLLPWDDELSWHEVAGTNAVFPGLTEWQAACGWSPRITETAGTGGRVRYYAGDEGAVASYEELDFAGAKEAASTAAAILDADRCVVGVWPDRGAGKDGGADVGGPGARGRVADVVLDSGARGRVYVVWDGERLAVLRVFRENGGAAADPWGDAQPDAVAACLAAGLTATADGTTRASCAALRENAAAGGGG